MPAGVVKPGTEEKWEQAKKAARGQLKPGSNRYWALVNYIYGRMTGRDKKLAAEWQAKSVNHLPDSAFAYVEAGGKKDSEGKTVPRSLRHFPLKNSSGEYDAAHVRNALARAPQSPFGNKAMPAIDRAAKALGIGKYAKDKQATAAQVIHIATFSVALPDEDPPEWITIMPAGKFSAVDGRGPFTNDEPAKLITASVSRMPRVGAVVDYDHSTDLAAPEGRPAIAAGWIKELRTDDGAILARIEWTPEAAAKIKHKEYRYISPVFEHDKNGQVERILRCALTNNPALTELPAIASAQPGGNPYEDSTENLAEEKTPMPPSMAEKKMTVQDMAKMFPPREDETMASHLARLMRHAKAEEAGDDETAGALADWADEEEQEPEHAESVGGESDEGKPEAVKPHNHEDLAARHREEMRAAMARCREEMAKETDASKREEMGRRHDEEMSSLFARHHEEMSMSTGIGKSKPEPHDVGGKEIIGHPAGHHAQMSAKTVRATVQPAINTLQREIGQLKADWARDTASHRVDQAISEGRLVPAQRARMIEYCMANPQGFLEVLAAQPRIIEKGEDGKFVGRFGELPDQDMSSIEMAICQNLGLDGVFGKDMKAKFIGARQVRAANRPPAGLIPSK